jgi:hypothetical protein
MPIPLRSDFDVLQLRTIRKTSNGLRRRAYWLYIYIYYKVGCQLRQASPADRSYPAASQTLIGPYSAVSPRG